MAGREEARLIYLGVAHSLPVTSDKRLVVDIGGGSTEFIIGSGYQPQQLESLYMGCVSYSLKFFPGGKLSKSDIKQAETRRAHRAADHRARSFPPATGRRRWARPAPRARSAEILEANGWSEGGITAEGLERLRERAAQGRRRRRSCRLPGLRPDRVPVLPGGFAIMSAIFAELQGRRT